MRYRHLESGRITSYTTLWCSAFSSGFRTSRAIHKFITIYLIKCLLPGWLLVFSFAVQAIDSHPISFKTPAQAILYDELVGELRCMVCPNQPLSDSEAELAQDLRDEVKRMVIDGQSGQDIKNFLVNRYGDMVLYKPRLTSKTWLLWLGPGVLLLIVTMILLITIRRRNQVIAAQTALSDEEQARLQRALGE